MGKQQISNKLKYLIDLLCIGDSAYVSDYSYYLTDCKHLEELKAYNVLIEKLHQELSCFDKFNDLDELLTDFINQFKVMLINQISQVKEVQIILK
jgi:hypothetical protein